MMFFYRNIRRVLEHCQFERKKEKENELDYENASFLYERYP